MRTSKILLGAAAICVVGAGAVFAQGGGAGGGRGAGAPPPPMSFFVASTVPGTGNLGGLAGADKICQDLATASGSTKTWHAYLSAKAMNGQPAVNARDRIGAGPWYNANGVLIANNLDELHGDTQRDRNNLKKQNDVTEKKEVVNGFGDMPNQHDMLTGSDSTGRVNPDPADTACKNWTSADAMDKAMLGHSDRNGGNNTSWNAAHMSAGCDTMGLIRTGGNGRFYCFAIN